MGMYENPSADKFGPPPGEDRFEPPKPRNVRRWSAVVLAILLFVARFELHHLRPTGWLMGLVLLGVFAVGVDFFAARLRDKQDGTDPHGPPQNITH